MPTNTAIQWTTHSWNPWQGCTKVTDGCRNCYMFRDKARYGQNPELVVRSKPPTFDLPLRATAAGKWLAGDRVFTCSWSDWFHPVADPWRDRAWAIVRETPHLTYQILTKRANRIALNLPPDWGERGYPNVWLGVSVEHQATDFRISQLAKVPAAVRFVSYEPALGPLAVGAHRGDVNWVIVGGESGGREARPFRLAWALDVLDECRRAGVPVFVKQLGSVWARANRAEDGHGGDPDEWPPDLRVREWPNVPRAQQLPLLDGALGLAAPEPYRRRGPEVPE